MARLATCGPDDDVEHLDIESYNYLERRLISFNVLSIFYFAD
jgi:hypothetical protein